MFTRRQFILTAGAAAGATLLPVRRALARRRQFPDVPLAVKKLRDDGKAWAITERGGNSLLLITAEGAILIDTKITDAADELLAKTTELASGAPALIINTHHHFDHVGSNYAFTPKAEIVAHQNVAKRMQATLDERIRPALAAKARTLRAAGKAEQADALAAKAQQLTLDQFTAKTEYATRRPMEFGGVKMALHHFGPGHTDNDSIIYLPDLNIIHMGDLLFHNLHAFIDRAGGASIIGWQNAVRRAMELCNSKTIVIPGHGAPPDGGITDRSALPKQIEYFDQLLEVVSKAIKEGKTKEQIAAMDPEVFRNRGFTQIRPNTLSAVYEELTQK